MSASRRTFLLSYAAAFGCAANESWELPPLDADTELLVVVQLPAGGGAPLITHHPPSESPELRVLPGDRVEVWAYGCDGDALRLTESAPPLPLPHTAQAFFREGEVWSAFEPSLDERRKRSTPRGPCSDLIIEASDQYPLLDEQSGVFDAAWLEPEGDRIVVLQNVRDEMGRVWVGDANGLSPTDTRFEGRAVDWDPANGVARVIVREGQRWAIVSLGPDGEVRSQEPGPELKDRSGLHRLTWADDGSNQAWAIDGSGAWSWFDGELWHPHVASAATMSHGGYASYLGDGRVMMSGWCSSAHAGECTHQITWLRGAEVEAEDVLPLDLGERVNIVGRSPGGVDYAGTSTGRLWHRAPTDLSWSLIPDEDRMDAAALAPTADGVFVGWSDDSVRAIHDGDPEGCEETRITTDVRRILVRGDRVVVVAEQTYENRSGLLDVTFGRLPSSCALPSTNE